MPLPDGERITAVEVELRGLREDVGALTAETLRTRTRLHSAEGTIAALVLEQRERRRRDKERDDRLNVRIQVLTLVVAAAAIVTPLVVGGVHP